MLSDRTRSLHFRHSLENLLESAGIDVGAIDSDQMILDKVSRLVLARKTSQEQKVLHVCSMCDASFESTHALYKHQSERHDPDGIMFSEIGLPK